MSAHATLHFFCGKMAAGKSTLANKLARDYNAVLICEDNWLSQLYPGEIKDIPDYIRYSVRLKSLLSEHIQSLLSHGITVVLDYPGNTIDQRAWFRHIYEPLDVSHVLHYIDASDEICKHQLRQRSNHMPEGSAFTSDAEFDAINVYFQPPSANEGFNIIKYTAESASL